MTLTPYGLPPLEAKACPRTIGATTQPFGIVCTTSSSSAQFLRFFSGSARYLMRLWTAPRAGPHTSASGVGFASTTQLVTRSRASVRLVTQPRCKPKINAVMNTRMMTPTTSALIVSHVCPPPDHT